MQSVLARLLVTQLNVLPAKMSMMRSHVGLHRLAVFCNMAVGQNLVILVNINVCKWMFIPPNSKLASHDFRNPPLSTAPSPAFPQSAGLGRDAIDKFSRGTSCASHEFARASRFRGLYEFGFARGFGCLAMFACCISKDEQQDLGRLLFFFSGQQKANFFVCLRGILKAE